MDYMDFQKRTRAFFSELRKKYKPVELSGPIKNRHGTLSRNLDETLKNWTNFYAKLYSNSFVRYNYHTPDENPSLDKDFTLAEFLDSIYSLNHHKAPGSDHITNEDITFLLPNDSEEDDLNPEKKVSSLRFIFKILPDFWFSECP